MRRSGIWRPVLVAALVGGSLATAFATAGPAEAQGWQGFSVSEVPSIVMNGRAPGWTLAITNDLGGPGVDVWNNNHGSLSEAIIDIGSTARLSNAIEYGSEILNGPDSHGAAFSDIDGDGDDDLFEVTGRNNNNRLFKNNGGVLRAVSDGGLADFFGRGRQPLFADFDGDGDMDVLITNLDLRSDPVPQNERQLIPSEVYLNNGDGTSWTKAPDPNQILDDGHVRMAQLTSTGPATPAITVTHDVFTLAKDSIAVGDGATLRAPATQAVTRTNTSLPIREVLIGDFDGDLYPEFVVFAASANAGDGTEPVTAYEVTAEGGAVTVSIPRSADLDNCRSGTSGDFDNDGDLDIIAGCTQVQEGQDRNVVLLNDGNGNFRDAGTAVLARTRSNTAAALATADIDGDGWLDAIVANGYDFDLGKDDILTNRGGTDAHWLSIDLVSTANPDAIGAQVFVGANTWQVRENGHAFHRSQDSRTLHFGLGNATAVAPIQVRWPDGSFETCSVGRVDQKITITQGGSTCDRQTRQGLLSAIGSAPVVSGQAPPPAARCGSRTVTVNMAAGERPTSGNDVILGTPRNDVINGLGGNDTICGLGGNDTIRGGSGADVLIGGSGADRLEGNIGADILYGGNGKDTLVGGAGNDVLNGGKKNDTLFGQAGNDRLNGNSGKGDVLNGGAGVDRFNGGKGSNDACSRSGTNEVRIGCERAPS